MKKKNIFFFFVSFLVLLFSLASCNNTTNEIKEEPKEEISLENFSIDAYKKTICVGESIELDVSFSPKEATNKDIIWKSSKEDVASISSGLCKGLTEGETTITAKTIDGKLESSVTINVVKKAKWTILMYACISNLDYSYDFTINDILRATGKPDDVNIIIEAGGSKNTDKLTRYSVKHDDLYTEEELDNGSMGTIAQFEDFLEWGLTNYPAEKTGLILWNHGGAMRGVCFDDNYGDRLTASKYKQSLTKAFEKTKTEEKLEFVAYDACLMGVQDLAEINSHYFKYMIASQDLSYGFSNYSYWLDNLYNDDPTESILNEVINSFKDQYTYYDENYYEGEYRELATLSLVDLSSMEDYHKAWENMALALYDKIDSTNVSSFYDLIESVEFYADEYLAEYSKYGYEIYGVFDALDFIHKLRESEFNPGDELLDKVEETFSKVVLNNYAAKCYKNTHGLSMFFSIYAGCDKNMYYTKPHTNFINWQKIVSKWGK